MKTRTRGGRGSGGEGTALAERRKARPPVKPVLPAEPVHVEEGGEGGGGAYGPRQRIGLVLGPLVFATMLLLPSPEGLSPEAWRTAATGMLMAVWWVSEALPIPATALVPLVAFPVLGVLPIGRTAAPYANPLIFLFLGGFVLALCMQRWQLHRRVALTVVRIVGTRPRTIVLGFILATALLSMWVSNTATAVMMLPIGLSIVALVVRHQADVSQPGESNFAVALMLGIAYGASIGGLATLIGTPPNALLAAFMLESYGVEIGFAQWMMVGLPLTAIALPLVWLLLTRVLYPIELKELPGGREVIDRELSAMGPVSRPERMVAVVFCLTAGAWIARPLLEGHLPGLSDTGIAIAAALALFLMPVDLRKGVFLMRWKDAEKLPWGVLILFGGGLALADAIAGSGLAEWIGGGLGVLAGFPTWTLVLGVALVVIFLTELTSNTATAAAFLPLVASIAIGLGHSPLLLAVPAALAASCAFMMPVATPPNAIVYGSGYVSIPQMVRAGWWLNLLFVAAITAVTYSLLILAFGVV
jgi:solute carrier family 13 (sodium-dependent dicarboxylate transporter), member 2/3/5